MSSGEKTGPSEPSPAPSGAQSSPPRANDDGPSGEGVARKPGRKRRAAAQCQVCHTGLHSERPYYQRYRICPRCSIKDRVGPDGALQRFCQQCGKFQEVGLFDATMRTCRERLNRHAARRRKAHSRAVASDYTSGAHFPLEAGYGGAVGFDGGFDGGGGGAGMLEAAQAVLQRVAAAREADTARYAQDPRLQYLRQAVPPPPPRPAQRDLLTPLLEPQPVRFHPPLFPSSAGSHLVDPAAAQARLESVLASASAAMAARRAGGAARQPHDVRDVEVEETRGGEQEVPTNHGQALRDALEWLLRSASGGDGGGQAQAVPESAAGGGAPPGGPLPPFTSFQSALGAALASVLRRAGGAPEEQRPGGGGGSWRLEPRQ